MPVNEIVFLIHVLVITICTIAATKIGKEALISVIALFSVLANLFVLKQITLFGLYPTASDAFSVGAIVGLNFLQEYFGKSITKKAIWICFFSLILYTIFSQIHLAYTPSSYDFSSIHYNALLQFMPRIAIASISVTLFVQSLDRIFFGFLKKKLQGKYFLMRSLIYIVISQLIDTILVSFAGLYGIVSNIGNIIIVSTIIKLATIAIMVPVMSLVKPKDTSH